MFVFRSCVRVVYSSRSGMGKSLFIQRMAEKLASGKDPHSVCVTIAIHGPHVSPSVVLHYLKGHYNDKWPMIFHFDIAPSVSELECYVRQSSVENYYYNIIPYVLLR